MKSRSTKAETANHDAENAPGQDGSALLPPSYGIDTLDRVLQPKLTINRPGDIYEQEADHAASQVMRMPAPAVQRAATSGITPTEAPPSVHETLRSSGQPLDTTTRTFMEQRFGQDFSQVRVHTDPQATQSAQDVDAKAYTVGQNVVFGAGEYAPESSEGKTLIAHELTHTIQQTGHAPSLQRFEAPVHQKAGRYGMTTARGGGLTNEEASAAYFGNWMRDNNQVLVPILERVGFKPDFIFAIYNYMAVKKFGREMSPEQFGYYIPAEHIDNPAGLVVNDDLFANRPPVSNDAAPNQSSFPTRPPAFDTPQEDVDPRTAKVQGANLFSVDQTGTMAFIRRSNQHVEKRLELAVKRGRNPEGMMHFDAALHPVEDLFAHSNWVEIAVTQLLAQKPTLLPQLKGKNRQIFNFSTTATIGRNKAGQPKRRPVLTTGSFTGSDTQISVSTEFIKFLRDPLPEPQSDAERKAEQRFMRLMVATFEGTLDNNPAFRESIRQILIENKVPGIVADKIVGLPLTKLYDFSTLPLPNIVPERARLAISRAIRAALEPAKQQSADIIEDAALDARIADTSLIKFLQENRETSEGKFSPVQEQSMKEVERFTGKSLADQKTEAISAAGRHVDALEATPEAVLAGPSHSQITKDHSNSPFFGLSFLLGTVAVQRLTEKIIAAWAEQPDSNKPFDFSWSNWPPAPPKNATPEQATYAEDTRSLYHANRTAHMNEANESLERARRIVEQGGDAEDGKTFHPFNLAAMRQSSANTIREAAAALRIASNSPEQATITLSRLNGLLGKINDLRVKKVNQKIAEASQVAQNASEAEIVKQLNATANNLDAVAKQVLRANTFELRQAANNALRQQRDASLHWLSLPSTKSDAARSSLAVPIIIMLEQEIANTDVAYTNDQRRVLAGQQNILPPAKRSPLTVTPLNLPDLATGPEGKRSPGLIALLKESRNLLTHPYEGNWWQSIVEEYITKHPEQILADIEARNTGVATFQQPRERKNE